MVFLHQVSLPTELIRHVCLFLSEKDLLSLYRTCPCTREALNDNVIWQRFVTEEDRHLESLQNPPLQLDSSLCENLQMILRRYHLLSNNWSTGRVTVYETNHDIFDLEFFFDSCWMKFYKEEYLYVNVQHGVEIQFWDISKEPVLHHTLKHDLRTLIGEYWVKIGSCLVDVYQINIKEKTISHKYSFAIGDDKISNALIRNNCGICCDRWRPIEAENYLVFYNFLCYDPPIFHIWDIANARKVGVFTSPRKFRVASFICLENNCLYLEVFGVGENVILKFDLIRKQLSENFFRLSCGSIIHNLTIYQNHCIKIRRNLLGDPSSLVCEVFEFDTSVKVSEQMFERAESYIQRTEVVDGKLVILSSDCFHVVDALTLQTVVDVPHGPDVHTILCQTSVLGSIFLLTLESDGVVKVWDIEKKTSTVLPVEKFSEKVTKIMRTKSYDLRCIIRGKEPLCKLVMYGEKKMYVTNLL